MLREVEPQPLLAQVKRVEQALEYLGQPLPEAARESLGALSGKHAATSVAERVQEHLDPLSLAAVEIGPDGELKVTPGPKKLSLVEQGWRTYLVKVVNRTGVHGVLRVDSPSARALPNAPANEVARRWLDLRAYTGQPLLASVSGLELEYRVVQLYSRDAGAKSAEFLFSLERSTPANSGQPSVVRAWRFDRTADGWKADNHCSLAVRDGSLQVTMTGRDPYMSSLVEAKRGAMVLRFWAKFEKSGMGQVFWMTRERPRPDGARRVNFPIEAGRGREYEVRFAPDGDLSGVRLDPGNDPGMASFDWITLNYAGDTNKKTARVELAFLASRSVPVTFRVTEFDGTPAWAAFLIRDAEGTIYPAQTKRLAPDFFFQPQIYRGNGETIHLPAGRYTVHCSRGPESIPEVGELVVAGEPTEFRYTVRRWINPSQRGWWSGDHHIHAAGCQHYENPTQGVHPPDMMRHILGEDLKVGCCLTWGPCFDYQKRFFTGKPDDVSRYPYLLRYDVEVSGFGSHVSGHLNLLRLREQIPAGGDSKDHWPTLGMNTLRWAKKQGAVCGPAHSALGLTRTVGRVEGAEDGPGGLPSYDIPAYDGIGANEFIVQAALRVPGPDGKPVPAVDFISTMNTDRRTEWNMWYHVLNCGLRVRASGETDFPCVSGERVGMGRVYVKLDGRLEFDRWVQGIADGRSYVSDGLTHLMDFTALHGESSHAVGVAGSEVKLDRPGEVEFKVHAAARYPGRRSVPVELVVNGLPVAKQELPSDGVARDLAFKAKIATSSWVAVRVMPGGHTNPFFVLVGEKPIRASRHSAEWCLRGVDQCWISKRNTYHPDERKQAAEDYEAARAAYRRILTETSR